MAEESGINHATFDRFSLAHVAFGSLMGRTGVGWRTTMLGAMLFEIAETPMKDARPSMFPHPSHDTLRNAIADVGVAMIGWWVMSRLNNHVTERETV